MTLVDNHEPETQFQRIKLVKFLEKYFNENGGRRVKGEKKSVCHDGNKKKVFLDRRFFFRFSLKENFTSDVS